MGVGSKLERARWQDGRDPTEPQPGTRPGGGVPPGTATAAPGAGATPTDDDTPTGIGDLIRSGVIPRATAPASQLDPSTRAWLDAHHGSTRIPSIDRWRRHRAAGECPHCPPTWPPWKRHEDPCLWRALEDGGHL